MISFRSTNRIAVIVAAIILTLIQLFLALTEEHRTSWTSQSPSSIPRTEGACAIYDGKLFSVAGFTLDVIGTHVSEVYDPESDTWSLLAPIPRAVSHVGAALVDGQIWIVGGFEGDHPGPAVDIVQIYDIATDTWIEGPPLPSPRASGTLALLGRRLHYIGGLLPDRQTDIEEHLVLDVDDLDAGWASAAPLPAARNHLSSVVLEGRIYAIGGQFGHDGGRTLSARVDVYDPSSETWSRRANLPLRRSHAEASTFVYNSRIIVAGGVGPGPNRTASLDLVTAYSVATDSWSELDVLPEKLLGPAVRIINEQFIVANGSIGLSGNAQLSTWSAPAEPESPDTLGFWPNSYDVDIKKGESQPLSVLIWTHQSDTPITIDYDGIPDWLTLRPGASSEMAGPAGSPLELLIETSELEPGTHHATISVTARGFPSASLAIALNVVADPLSSVSEPPRPSNGTALASNFPNPFGGVTLIPYSLGTYSHATISVYNLLGERVAVLVNGSESPGAHEVAFNADHLPNGPYLYELRAGAFRQALWMTLVR